MPHEAQVSRRHRLLLFRDAMQSLKPRCRAHVIIITLMIFWLPLGRLSAPNFKSHARRRMFRERQRALMLRDYAAASPQASERDGASIHEATMPT